MRSERVKRGKRSRRSKKSKRMGRVKRTKASRTKRTKRSRRTRVKRSRTRSRTRRTRRTRKSRRMRGGAAEETKKERRAREKQESAEAKQKAADLKEKLKPLEAKKKEAADEIDRLLKLDTDELKTLAQGVDSNGLVVRDKLTEIQKKIGMIYNIRIWIANNPENTPKLIKYYQLLKKVVGDLDKLISDGEVQVIVPRKVPAAEALKGAAAAALIEDDSGNSHAVSTFIPTKIASLEQAAERGAATEADIQKLNDTIVKMKGLVHAATTDDRKLQGLQYLITLIGKRDTLSGVTDTSKEESEITAAKTKLSLAGTWTAPASWKN